MQIRTMSYHLSPVRMAMILKNKTTKDKRWAGCGGPGTLRHCAGGKENGAAALENGMGIPRKIKTSTPV